MLKLTDICKSYKVADFEQTALNKVSVSFRDNEFVAILGPSGSGKTTLLNIIGGLDRYDSGDLAIDNISTKQFKDRDWDTYRNNRIGFVFQSYNLIPHQTVLENVELALTLSGVSREERKKRALEELDKVGLSEHIGKKPSQLSGGQMQRVAIARALINDPEILLADEPTGALDSKTSVQIMDLLTEVAKDRLVIMVTHNPELAEQYATRIVTLSDGVITSDTDPYAPTQEDLNRTAKEPKRTHMSFLTALSLSFRNLMTKKGRTFMTAFAGSIGIIGIAGILSLSNGVNEYIRNVEEETLSEYPLQIQSTGFDMTTLLMNSAADSSEEEQSESSGADGASEGKEAPHSKEESVVKKETDTVRIANVVANAFTSLDSNDLASLKEYLESGESDIDEHVNAIEYSYNVVPQVFSADTSQGVHQVNPDKTFAALGLGSGGASGIMSMAMSTDVFFEMPATESLYKDSYDIVAGRWPENYNECILVLTANGYTSDFAEYAMGFRDYQELKGMIDSFVREEDVEDIPDIEPYQYKDILDVRFKTVNACDYYSYDADRGVYVNKNDNDEYLKNLVDNGEDLKIVGVVQKDPDVKVAMLRSGINYLPSLREHMAEAAMESQVVKDQLADSTVNVLTGKPFGEEDDGGNALGLENMFSVDSAALSQAFNMDTSVLSLDSSSFAIDPSAIDPSAIGSMSFDDMPPFNPSGIQPGGDPAAINEALAKVFGEYFASITVSDMLDFDLLKVRIVIDPQSGWPRLDFSEAITFNQKFTDDFLAYVQSEDVQTALSQAVAQALDLKGMEQQVSAAMQEYVQNQLSVYLQNKMMQAMAQMTAAIETQVASAMSSSFSNLGTVLSGAMSIDEAAFANAFKFSMSEDDLTDAIMSMMGAEEQTYENNLKNMGYVDVASPYGISIYPKDFEHKDVVVDILDGYNEKMEEMGADEKVITYVDMVGTLMTSVTDIINKITAVMAACVAISLIVSSIMIGVITYISVLERKKEIGILRSIGASKRDIGNVFNAETVIVGFIAGTMGIIITALGTIPANIIVEQVFDVKQIAILPLVPALGLIVLSVFLTFLAGLIPSSAASRKDPVEALRSE